MESSLIVIAIAIGIIVIFIFGVFSFFSKYYCDVKQGYAMIVMNRGKPEVAFTGRMVYPVIHKAEMMDISLKTIEILRTGKDGLICRDSIRADIKMAFFVQVNRTVENVLKVAQGIGCARASNKQTLEELFSAKFSEAMEIVGKSMDFADIFQERDKFRDEIMCQIGVDLFGFELVDAAIYYLEQTPLSSLDPNDIFDAQGIRKITELTAQENVRTTEYRCNEQVQIKKKDVETLEALYALERQRAEAERKHQREIASLKARENTETEARQYGLRREIQ